MHQIYFFFSVAGWLRALESVDVRDSFFFLISHWQTGGDTRLLLLTTLRFFRTAVTSLAVTNEQCQPPTTEKSIDFAFLRTICIETLIYMRNG